MRIFLYSLQTAIKNLWLDKLVNTLTSLTIAVGLLILATFILITMNMDSALKRWSKDFGLIVYLDGRAGEAEEDLLREYFQKDSDVTEIQYISKESAMIELRETLGEMNSMLEGFQENPLPSSFELKLRSGALEPEYIRQKAYQIKQLNGVDDVQYGDQWLSSLNTMTKGMKIVVILLGGIILVAIAFSTYTTMKILFYRRKDEIETLKLLGATRGFIRFPFLLEGLIIGLVGGIAGFLCLLLLHKFATVKISEFMPSVQGAIMFFPLQAYPAAPIAGAVMSLIGSIFAVGKIRY